MFDIHSMAKCAYYNNINIYICMIYNIDNCIGLSHFQSMMTLLNGNIFRVTGPHNGHWREAFIFSFICPWINRWVNNGEAGDLRCHCAHYDVIVMLRTVNNGYRINHAITCKMLWTRLFLSPTLKDLYKQGVCRTLLNHVDSCRGYHILQRQCACWD